MFKKKVEEKKQGETLLDKMQKSKDQHGVAYISIFNDKQVKIDKQFATAMMKYANDDDAFDSIGDFIYKINEGYSRDCDFDTLVINLSIGLLFDGKDMDDNIQIKPDAEPVNGVVRYYTSSSCCYLNGEQTSKIDRTEIRGDQGFINYNILVEKAEANGLTFNGPRTFEEFKEQILIGEPFDISLSASLTPFFSKEKETQPVKVKQKEVDR